MGTSQFWNDVIYCFLQECTGTGNCLGSDDVGRMVQSLFSWTSDFRCRYKVVFLHDYELDAATWKLQLPILFSQMFDTVNMGRIVGFFDIGRYVCEQILNKHEWTMEHESLFNIMRNYFMENLLVFMQNKQADSHRCLSGGWANLATFAVYTCISVLLLTGGRIARC